MSRTSVAARARRASAVCVLAVAAPLIMGAAFPQPVASPPEWVPTWVVALEESALYSSATTEEVLSLVPVGTFYRVDAPALEGRAWVLNPLTQGWGWLPLEGTAPHEEPSQEQVAAFFVPPAPPSPRRYLYETYPELAPRMDCVIHYESRWDPQARNPWSTASGLAQFIDSTWRRTPQGQAGHSPFDPYASIDAMAWMVTGGGSWWEWAVVTRGLC